MKKILLITTSLGISFFSKAQDYAPIKNLAITTQYAKAKTELDKKMTDAQFTSKAEFYILKALIYSSLSMTEKVKGTPEQITLVNEADVAYRKYKQMDLSLGFLTDLVYQNGVINIYSSYYTAGYNDYVLKKLVSGYSNIQKAVEYSDLLIQKKLLGTDLDTNVLVLAGIMAEQNGYKDDAVKFYSRLADRKLSGNGFESIYRFLVSYYFTKQDISSFQKYKASGALLYPQSEFFKFDEVDFAVGLETSLAAKLKALEKILARDPNHFKANQVMGEIIYDTLNPSKENVPLPSNAAELEKKMVAAFNKAAIAKPDYENSLIYIGDHFINKATRLVATDKLYGEYLEKARLPYEKAAAILAKKTSLTDPGKKQYKKAASYLADIYAHKKIQAKGTADEAKYAAEEKKWNAMWESIK